MATENKYEMIVNASIKVMKEKGFEKASVSQIVKEAGVAQGTFYLYFDSKSAVVPAIAKRILNTLFTKVKEVHLQDSHIFDTIDALVDITFEITREYRELILFCYSGLAYYHSLEIWEEIYQPYYNWLECQLKSAKEAGLCTSKVELAPLARMIINVIETSAEAFYLSNQGSKETAINKDQVVMFIKSTLTDYQS
ncbi:TetR family transcriptional regulator [Halalkalibacter okhensis]|uniref:TetR family transcriptional regulator n=1 Tax=Halalkalibacter okhensis TaxID=333138 RepID=A0A0B0IN86_9BACI|nr:TetR family transcriptional regulator [Halalkalibacter okhensis]KHF41529.1 TetR family transcriptional regulator [Halalkalibacter okhensis]